MSDLLVVWSVAEGAEHHLLHRHRQRMHASAEPAHMDGLERLRKHLLALRKQGVVVPDRVVDGGLNGMLRAANALIRRLREGERTIPEVVVLHRAPGWRLGESSWLTWEVSGLLADYNCGLGDEGLRGNRPLIFLDCFPLPAPQWTEQTAVIPHLQAWLSKRGVVERDVKPENMVAFHGVARWNCSLGLRNKQDELALLLAELPGELQSCGHRFSVCWQACDHNAHGDRLAIWIHQSPTPLMMSMHVHVVKPTRQRGRLLPPALHQTP